MAESESVRLRRALRIILLLSQQKKGLSVYEIAKHEERNVKTIRRDIKLLKDEGLPIEETLADRGKKLWKITAKVDQIAFEYHELLSLFLGRRLLEPFAGTPLFEGIHSLFQKLETQLFSESKALQDSLTDGFHLKSIGASDYSGRSQLISTVLTAVQQRTVLSVTYKKNNAPAPSEYQLHPYSLVYHRSSLYLIALSVAAAEMRHFKLDRLLNIEVLPQRFEVPKSFDMRAYLEKSFGIFSPTGRTFLIKIQFAPTVAGTVRESRWHRSQEIIENEDGSLMLKLKLGNLEEIKSWVMGFGCLARVLEPRELVEAIRQDVRQMAESYS
jgi:proteasome accessory factor B